MTYMSFSSLGYLEKLRAKIHSMLTNPSYKEVALKFKAACKSAGGVQRAADIIEAAVATGKPVLQGD